VMEMKGDSVVLINIYKKCFVVRASWFGVG
jgi:hypothetical protein